MTNYNADFLSSEEMRRLPFRSLGTDVLIDRNVSLVNIENISIGSHTRIDAYAMLIATGPISIGSYVHVSASTYFAGRGGIELDDFSNISSGVKVYSISDDFSGGTMTNPLVPEQFKALQCDLVKIGRHVVIGTGSVILPGVHIQEGCAIGALCLVKHTTEPWGIYAGIPARHVGERSHRLLSLEEEFLAAFSSRKGRQ